jgi:hypothetical protein
MNVKILAGLEFDAILNEAVGQTQSGNEMLNKYKSFMMANNATCALVNNFVREAAQLRFDNGVNKVLEQVSDYISSNKTSWALACACESINGNGATYNYLNRNAAKQVESLLESDEETVVKYIKAGALKNVMFCEAFRNIVKQVYADTPVVESTAEYTAVHPISLVESAGDGFLFEVAGTVYKIDDTNKIQEAAWSDVSNTFKTVSSLLESNMVSFDQGTLTAKIGNGEYTISEADEKIVCKRVGKNNIENVFETPAQLREHNNLVVAGSINRGIAAALEALALTFENYENIKNLDNVAIYTTNRDRFVVIESGTDLYATLLQSNHNTKWTVNENAVSTLSFIKAKTNVELGEVYNEAVKNHMANVDEEERKRLEEEAKVNEKNGYKERIAALTEKFKNDPAKLAILSELAAKLADAE